MKKFIILFVSILYFSTINLNLHAQWVQQTVPSGIGVVLSLDFQNSLTGIASGWKLGNGALGRFLKTTNSGQSWTLVTLPDSISSITEVEYISGNTYYACASYYPPNNFQLKTFPSDQPAFTKNRLSTIGRNAGGFTNGCFLKSQNGGTNWSILELPPDIQFVYSMDFVDQNLGYLCADKGYANSIILKTTDGGANWLEMPFQDSLLLNNVAFANSLTGFAVGTRIENNNYYGFHLRTTNGGNLWLGDTISHTLDLQSVTCVNPDTLFLCGGGDFSLGDWGVIFKSTNGGNNWSRVSLDLSAMVTYEIDFIMNSGTGILIGPHISGSWMVDRNIIMKTSDYGETWIEDSVSHLDPIICSKMLSDENWYIGGGFKQGTLFHTTNAGSVFIDPIGGIIPSDYELKQNYPNPFNPVTKIDFSIPSSEFTSIIVYDLLGREVRTLVNEKLSAGNYRVDFNADGLNTGIYFYRLRSGTTDIVKKMMYIK